MKYLITIFVIAIGMLFIAPAMAQLPESGRLVLGSEPVGEFIPKISGRFNENRIQIPLNYAGENSHFAKFFGPKPEDWTGWSSVATYNEEDEAWILDTVQYQGVFNGFGENNLYYTYKIPAEEFVWVRYWAHAPWRTDKLLTMIILPVIVSWIPWADPWLSIHLDSLYCRLSQDESPGYETIYGPDGKEYVVPKHYDARP